MANLRPLPKLREFDLAQCSLRDLNLFLHKQAAIEGVSQIHVKNPDGAHSIACGLDADLDVQIRGHVGYYVAGMNKHASVTVHGNAGPGAAENMMSGRVRQCRQFFRVHGAGGPDRHLRRCRGLARRFIVRSGHLCTRQGALARRRRSLRADDRYRSRRPQEFARASRP